MYAFWFVPADDTTWVEGNEIEIWTGFKSGSSAAAANRSATIVLGTFVDPREGDGAAALTLVSSALLAAAAILF